MSSDNRTSAGVVLAGGRSSRMGTPKAALEWHGSTLLYRTAALLNRVVSGSVVVVAAPGQKLPRLPDGVTVVEDPIEGFGPMQGLARGLSAVADEAAIAFVCSTDLPFLHPAFVAAVLRRLRDNPEVDIVMPVTRGFRQPLAAGYRPALFELIARRVAEGDRRPGQLFEHCRVEQITDRNLLADPVLARLDPELDSMVNLNEPHDYTAARERPAPEVLVERFGTLTIDGHQDPKVVRAGTLGVAAKEVGLTLDRQVLAELNGEKTTSDPELPLVAGDNVGFIGAGISN